MWPLGVVLLDPCSDRFLGLLDRLEAVKPDALFLERPKHPLHEAVLLRGVRRDVLLRQAVVPDRLAVGLRQKDQPVVRPEVQVLTAR